MVTVAPLRTAPLGSVTPPKMRPVVVWAANEAQRAKIATTTATPGTLRFSTILHTRRTTLTVRKSIYALLFVNEWSGRQILVRQLYYRVAQKSSNFFDDRNWFYGMVALPDHTCSTSVAFGGPIVQSYPNLSPVRTDRSTD